MGRDLMGFAGGKMLAFERGIQKFYDVGLETIMRVTTLGFPDWRVTFGLTLAPVRIYWTRIP
jgi:hypothetical protein